jgi:hypothetical protein
MLNYADRVALQNLLDENNTPGHPRRGMLTHNEKSAIQSAIGMWDSLEQMAAAMNRAQHEKMERELNEWREAMSGGAA